jgi:hypothetical protein
VSIVEEFSRMFKRHALAAGVLSVLAMPMCLNAQMEPRESPPMAERNNPKQELKHMEKSLKLSEE